MKFLLKLLIVLAVLAGLIFAGWTFFGKQLMRNAVIENVGINIGLTYDEVTYIEENLTEAEKELVDKVITEFAEPEIISECITYIKDEDIDGLKEEVEKTLSEDEIEGLYAIYTSHSDDPKLQELIQERIQDN